MRTVCRHEAALLKKSAHNGDGLVEAASFVYSTGARARKRDAMRCDARKTGKASSSKLGASRKPFLARGGSFAMACNRCKGQNSPYSTAAMKGLVDWLERN